MEKTLDYYMKLQYKIELEQVIHNENQQKHFLLGHIEELPGCSTHADTIEELSEQLEIVKKLYFENLLNQGVEIPEPGDLSLRDGERRNRSSRVRIEMRGWMDEE